MHGGASTGPRTVGGRIRHAVGTIKDGRRSRLCQDPAGTIAEWEARSAADPDAACTVVDIIALARRLIARLADVVDHGGTVQAISDGVVQALMTAMGRLESAVQTQRRIDGRDRQPMIASNTLAVTFSGMSVPELETVVRVLGDPALEPLQRLLVPLLDSGALIAGRTAVEAEPNALCESENQTAPNMVSEV